MPPRRPYLVSLLVLSLASTLTADTASAQDRLLVFGQEVGAIGRFGQKLGDAPPWVRRSTAGDPLFIAGGRFVLATEFDPAPAEYRLVPRVFETFTGREVPLPASGRVVPDPLRPRVFLLDGQNVHSFDLESGATRVLAAARSVPYPPPVFGPPPLPEARYASGADRLFVRRADETAVAWQVAVLDADTGSLIRTLPDLLPLGFLADWTVTPDGAQVMAATNSLTGGPTLRAIDVATGQTVTAPLVSTGTLVYDDRFQRVFVRGGSGTGYTRVFDRQLDLLATFDDGYCISNVRTSPHTGRVYHLRAAGGGGSYYGPIDTRIEAFDGATGQVLGDASLTAALGMGTDRPVCGDYSLLLVTAPGAPRDLTATVTGRDVSLTWQNVGDATSFVLDVGLAPGRTDLSVYRDGRTSAAFSGVPSGRFYIRVRGANAFGGGRPSGEVVVTVP